MKELFLVRLSNTKYYVAHHHLDDSLRLEKSKTKAKIFESLKYANKVAGMIDGEVLFYREVE